MLGVCCFQGGGREDQQQGPGHRGGGDRDLPTQGGREAGHGEGLGDPEAVMVRQEGDQQEHREDGTGVRAEGDRVQGLPQERCTRWFRRVVSREMHSLVRRWVIICQEGWRLRGPSCSQGLVVGS